MIIIGITGTLGAGKGTVVEYLTRVKGFVHYSVRAFIVEEIKRRGLDVNRDTMVIIANDMRKQHTPAYMAESLYERAAESGKNCVIESIRTVGEIESLRNKKNFYLFAVDADPEIRYRRITQRGTETDHITFSTFIDNERREMTSNDPNHQNISRCIALADYVFTNDGSREELYKQLEFVLDSIL